VWLDTEDNLCAKAAAIAKQCGLFLALLRHRKLFSRILLGAASNPVRLITHRNGGAGQPPASGATYGALQEAGGGGVDGCWI
jgi:hypothetical protein